MVTKRTWDEFRETGLLLIINQILHIFGWSIVMELDEEENVQKTYPARVKFRGFDNNSVDKAYKKITQYMKNNITSIYDDAMGDEIDSEDDDRYDYNY